MVSETNVRTHGHKSTDAATRCGIAMWRALPPDRLETETNG